MAELRMGWNTAGPGLALCMGLLATGGCETAAPPTPPATPAAPTPSTPGTATVPFSSGVTLASDASLLDGPSLTEVKPATMRTLFIRTKIPNVEGLSSVNLSFVNPEGQPFFARTFAFTSEPVKKGAPMLDVLHPTVIPGGYALDVIVPLAGSPFERNGTEGAWTLNLDVERGRSVQSFTSAFALNLKQ